MQHHDKRLRGRRGREQQQRQAEASIQCYECNEYDSQPGNEMLLCDGCGDWGCHLQCADPPLDDVPDGEWYCMYCQD